MRSFKKIVLTAVSLLALTAISGCSLLGLEDDEDDTTLLTALAAAVAISNSGYTLDAATGCVSGVASSMSSSLPAWIQNNFKCSVGTVSGSNFVFTSQNLPNTKSYYYGTGSALYEALPSGNTAAGSNVIGSQNYTYTIPATPVVNGGAKTATSVGSIGITVNGLAVFSNAAAPGDTLAAEVGTFDNFNGHPQQQSIYHHHINPANISASSDANLIGIAIDGYAIYGLLCDQGTTTTADDVAPGTGTPALDVRHGHTANTIHQTGVYHYHYALDGTATINTLMGSNYHGIVGTATN
ncbi:MAG: YHYH protein [Leptospirales bacterium]